MKRTLRHRVLLPLLAAAVALPAAAADEPTLSEIVNILREQGLIDADQHAELAAKATREQEKKAWTERIGIWGDFRGRYEGFLFEQDVYTRSMGMRLKDRHRVRYRGRLNVSGEVNDHATVYFRFVSGGADPRSTNQTLGSGLDFDTDDLRFDLAYATLTPFADGELPGIENGYLAADVGKVPNPFIWKALGADKLLFDGDLTLEGGSLRAKGSTGPVDLFANGGVYIIDENSGAKDPKLAGGQLGGIVDVADHVSVGGRGSLYHFFSLDAAFFGRTAANAGPGGTGGGFADGIARPTSSIQVLEGSAFVGLSHSELFPVLVYGTYAHNLSARSSLAFPGVDREDDAYAVGVFVGDKKRLVRLGFAYYRIEANAFPSMFIDSDILDGTPNRHGYVVSLDRSLLPNVDFGFKGFLSDRIEGGPAFAASGPASDRMRGQFDVVFKF